MTRGTEQDRQPHLGLHRGVGSLRLQLEPRRRLRADRHLGGVDQVLLPAGVPGGADGHRRRQHQPLHPRGPAARDHRAAARHQPVRPQVHHRGDAIRYGLDSVHDVGEKGCTDILAARPYTTLEDYLARAGRGAEKTTAYNLILIGAFDSLGPRAEMLRRLERYRATDKLAESTLANPERLEKIVAQRLASGKYETIQPPTSTDPAWSMQSRSAWSAPTSRWTRWPATSRPWTPRPSATHWTWSPSPTATGSSWAGSSPTSPPSSPRGAAPRRRDGEHHHHLERGRLQGGVLPRGLGCHQGHAQGRCTGGCQVKKLDGLLPGDRGAARRAVRQGRNRIREAIIPAAGLESARPSQVGSGRVRSRPMTGHAIPLSPPSPRTPGEEEHAGGLAPGVLPAHPKGGGS